MIEQQTAELTFRFDGTERNGNVTVFMPPTVFEYFNWTLHVHIHYTCKISGSLVPRLPQFSMVHAEKQGSLAKFIMCVT